MNRTIQIDIPKDADGFMGRECLECKRYFKLKPGTGLPTSYCHCPYCDYEGESNTFWTSEQLEYAYSVGKKQAYQQIVEPFINDIGGMFKDLERQTRSGFLQIKVTQTGSKPYFPIKTYSEKNLETHVTCDNCNLEFAVYGVFAMCPDCKQLNAFTVFKKSIEVTQKLIDFVNQNDFSEEIKEVQLKAILINSISSFDALGKALKNKFAINFPDKPKNLFQNLTELDTVLAKEFGLKISENRSTFDFLLKLFQVRHIYEHNMGVIDDDFLRKVPSLQLMKGRKYKLESAELKTFLMELFSLAEQIQDALSRITF